MIKKMNFVPANLSAESMNENFKYIAAAVAVVGLSIGAVIYISYHEGCKRYRPPAACRCRTGATRSARGTGHQASAAEHPAQEPLPSLNDSDEPMQNALAGLIGKESVERFVITKDLVRHIVVSVDNLTTRKWPNGFAP